MQLTKLLLLTKLTLLIELMLFTELSLLTVAELTLLTELSLLTELTLLMVLPIPNIGVATSVSPITSLLRNCMGEQADQSGELFDKSCGTVVTWCPFSPLTYDSDFQQFINEECLAILDTTAGDEIFYPYCLCPARSHPIHQGKQ